MAIIAVAHGKGGVGKTTTSQNIVYEFKPNRVFDQDLHDGLRVLNMLRTVPAPFPIEHYDNVDDLLNALQKSQEAGEDVLVDCGGYDSDLSRAVLAVADLIICPCNDTPTDRTGLGKFDVALSEISAKMDRHITAHVLLCKVHPSQKHFAKLDADLEKAQHLKRMRSIIAYRPDHYRCHEEGRAVTELPATRHSAAGREIVALVEEMRELLA